MPLAQFPSTRRNRSRPARAGLERLLRYCARPPFALERLELIDDAAVFYRLPQTTT